MINPIEMIWINLLVRLKIISGSTALVEYKKGSVIMCLPFGLNPEQCTRSDWDTVHHLKEKDFTNNSYIFKLEE